MSDLIPADERDLPVHDPVPPLDEQDAEFARQIETEPLPESPEPDPELG